MSLLGIVFLSSVFILLSITSQTSYCSSKEQSGSGKSNVLDYGDYVEKFHKEYNPVETLAKAKLFYGRTMLIFKHNVLYKTKDVSYYLNQNAFTDMPAEELRFLQADPYATDLEPIEESLVNPDLPANLAPSVLKLSQGVETYTQLSLDDLNERRIDEKTRLDSFVNFNKDQVVDDLNGLLKDFNAQPKITKKLKKLLSTEDLNHGTVESDALKHKKFVRTAVVPSNNRNYDPQLIRSMGIRDTVETIERNYARYLVDDSFADGIDLSPYPKPVVSTAPILGKDENKKSGLLSSFISAAASVRDYLLNDDWFDDEEDEEEEEEEEEDPTDGDKDSADKQITSQHSSTNNNLNGANYQVDWRSTGCIPVAKNQGTCNSCYAFTTLTLMEYFYCLQMKAMTEFSVQYIIDCGEKTELRGCKGGRLGSVGLFIRNHGIELNSLYPYEGRENQCPYTKEDDRKSKTGYLRPKITAWQRFTNLAAWYQWLKKSPVLVGINLPVDFAAYGGGIHDGQTCEPGMVHSMLLVGSGVQDGKEFWLLLNSYSTTWGEGGYFKLAKDAPIRCFDSAIVARVKFTDQADHVK